MAIVKGTNASETISSPNGVTNGDDVIFGYEGSDKIYGLWGNDTIKGGGGADTIYGGFGNDTASYADSAVGVVVMLDNGGGIGAGFGGTAEGDTLVDVENLTGSSYGDFLIGDGGVNVLKGLAGNDTLKGGDGADTLEGGDGNDILKGGGGSDTLNGGSGIDTADYSESPSAVYVDMYTYGGAGGDGEIAGGDAEWDHLISIENLTGSDYDDTLWGTNGVNVLKGLDGHDFLQGFGSDDTLDGGTDDDTLRGDTGNDTYYVDSASDVIIEFSGEGNDTVYALANYTLAANVSVEVLSLQMGSATSATGNNLSQTVFGNAGNNVIDGGGGSDTLSGLGGNDTFVFHAGQANGDVVFEFQGNGAGAGDSLTFAGFGMPGEGASFTQVSPTEWIIHSGLDAHEEVITLYADAMAQVGATVHPSDLIWIL